MSQSRLKLLETDWENISDAAALQKVLDKINLCLDAENSYLEKSQMQSSCVRGIETLELLTMSDPENAAYVNLWDNFHVALAKAIYASAYVYGVQDDFEISYGYYNQAIKEFEKVSPQIRNEYKALIHEFQFAAYLTLINKTTFFMEQKDYLHAKETALAAIEELKKVDVEYLQQKAPQEHDVANIHLARASLYLGHVFIEEKEFLKSLLEYQAAIVALKNVPVDEFPEEIMAPFDKLIADFSRACAKYAGSLMDNNLFPAATQYYQMAIKNLEILPQEKYFLPLQEQYFNLSLNLNVHAKFLAESNKLEEAIMTFRSAKDVYLKVDDNYLKTTKEQSKEDWLKEYNVILQNMFTKLREFLKENPKQDRKKFDEETSSQGLFKPSLEVGKKGIGNVREPTSLTRRRT
jgi:tetratricopeptide (TPR) repeat protein